MGSGHILLSQAVSAAERDVRSLAGFHLCGTEDRALRLQEGVNTQSLEVQWLAAGPAVAYSWEQPLWEGLAHLGQSTEKAALAEGGWAFTETVKKKSLLWATLPTKLILGALQGIDPAKLTAR